MSFVKRIVLDTSTLISAALRVESVPSQAFLKALGGCEICTSHETLQELDEVLSRPKFDRYLHRAERVAFVELLSTYATKFEVHDSVDDCRDPKDNKFLALAIACTADILVASDKNLRSLHPYRGIPVITPSDFLIFNIIQNK
jgi:putative PIN family toxin of toxin-antitoxin system